MARSTEGLAEQGKDHLIPAGQNAARMLSCLSGARLHELETTMKIVPNIGTPMRIGYVVAGAALITAPFVAGMEGWIRVAVPILGALALVEGLAGW